MLILIRITSCAGHLFEVIYSMYVGKCTFSQKPMYIKEKHDMQKGKNALEEENKQQIKAAQSIMAVATVATVACNIVYVLADILYFLCLTRIV